MIRSMTGYGSATHENQKFAVKAEIKSLNSKIADIKLKVPAKYFEKEIEIHKYLEKELIRGKIDFVLSVKYNSPTQVKRKIDKELFRAYLEELKALDKESKLHTFGMMDNIFRNFPEVISASGNGHSLDENEWNFVMECLSNCVNNFDKFRINEGKTLVVELKKYLSEIDKTLSEVESAKDNRIEIIRERINEKLSSAGSEDLNTERLEQEMIYYLEKLDITEEVERLKSHIAYFLENLEIDYAGKKLNFISQEMGREINTMGAKANDFGIQKFVVMMKDELEKIKQQLSNIL